MSNLDESREKIGEIDKQIADLFEKRMDVVGVIAEYKREHDLRVEDVARERTLIRDNCAYIKNSAYKPYYTEFQNAVLDVSKAYQHRLLSGIRTPSGGENVAKTVISVKTALGGYDIIVERGSLNKADKYFDLKRKVLIVTDDGVPGEYAEALANLSEEALTLVIKAGEPSKNFDNYKRIIEALVGADFTRTDCIVAVGGGVVGDMAGFAAATYMRGIDFYNVPTTVLAQVDSSVGGKTAIDFCGYKNILGSFYPPKCVIVDTNTLKTLEKRQISNGLAESLKMAATCDEKLFSIFENDDPIERIDEIIIRSIGIKKSIVDADEHESGLRRVLNFGHTVGHAIESNCPELLHGECVGIGMLHMCSPQVKERIKSALNKLNLPTYAEVPFEKAQKAILHDKKTAGDKITTVFVDDIGSYRFLNEETKAFSDRIKREWNK
ncbi:MAG: 3-dehydroquinate synthase [Clostridia bacterium]|nr:3-dehydroquinate synthase [Clostridia bacterium]